MGRSETTSDSQTTAFQQHSAISPRMLTFTLGAAAFYAITIRCVVYDRFNGPLRDFTMAGIYNSCNDCGPNQHTSDTNMPTYYADPLTYSGPELEAGTGVGVWVVSEVNIRQVDFLPSAVYRTVSCWQVRTKLKSMDLQVLNIEQYMPSSNRAIHDESSNQTFAFK